MKVKSLLLFILISLVPIAFWLVGVIDVVTIGVINRYHLIAFVAFPILWLSLNAFGAFVAKSKAVKVLVALAVLPMLCVSLVLVILVNYELLRHYDAEDLADSREEIIEPMYSKPVIEDMGSYEDIDYYYFIQSHTSLFVSETGVYICKYGEAEYAAQKAYLAENYVYEEDDSKYTTEIDGFTFRCLDSDTYYLYFPKYAAIVGTNDETHEIAYLSFYDIDLDYIDTLDEFIVDDCGWEHIEDSRKGIPVQLGDIIRFFKGLSVSAK